MQLNVGSRSMPVYVLALVAAVLASYSGASPTGLRAWDAFLTGALAAAFVVAMSKAPRWVSIFAAAVSAVFVGWSLLLVVAVVAQAVSLATIFNERRSRIPSALVGALSIQALLRLPAMVFFGFPSVVAGLTIVVVLVAGYKYASRSARRGVRAALGISTIILCAIAAVGATALVEARIDANRGVTAARAGLAAAREGKPDEVAQQLSLAEVSLTEADDQLASSWLTPLRLIPVVAHNFEAIATGTTQGSDIASAAANLNRAVDLQSMQLSPGALDLAALSAVAPDLGQTVGKLENALLEIELIRSPWLVGSLDRAFDGLVDEIDEVLPQVRVAAAAAEVVPRMLGSEGPRRYLVAFGTPAESREFGGLMGSWVLIEMNDGVPRTIDSGRAFSLYGLARSNILDAAQYPLWYSSANRPDVWPQNLTGSPSIDVVARATAEVLDGIGDGSIDGVIYVDTRAAIDLFALTGPITVPWSDVPLTSANAADFFFRDQYLLESTRTETFEELALVLESIVKEVGTGELPGPEALGSLLGPAARGGRIQIATFDEEENAFLESVQLHRVFERPVDVADAFALVQSNATGSKLDIYLEREVWYDVAVDSTGNLSADLRVELTSAIPENPPPYTLGTGGVGDGALLLSLYSPHRLLSVEVAGVPAEYSETRESDYWRYLVTVEIPANTTQEVKFSLAGFILDENYDLSIWHQPLVNDDLVHINHIDSTGEQTAFDLTLLETVVVSTDG